GWVVAFLPEAVTPPEQPAGPPLAGDPRWMAFMRSPRGQRGPYRLTGECRTRCAGLIVELHRELRDQQPGYPRAVRALLSLLLIEVTRLALGDLGDLHGRVDPVVGEAFVAIDELFRGPVTLEQ